MPQKTYNAINGAEALEVAVQHFRKALSDTGEFTQNQIFPCWKMEFKFNLQIFPRDNPDIEVTAELEEKQAAFKPRKGEEGHKAEGQDSLGWVGANPTHQEGLHDVILEPGIPPDKIREEHGLPDPEA